MSAKRDCPDRQGLSSGASHTLDAASEPLLQHHDPDNVLHGFQNDAPNDTDGEEEYRPNCDLAAADVAVPLLQNDCDTQYPMRQRGNESPHSSASITRLSSKRLAGEESSSSSKSKLLKVDTAQPGSSTETASALYRTYAEFHIEPAAASGNEDDRGGNDTQEATRHETSNEVITSQKIMNWLKDDNDEMDFREEVFIAYYPHEEVAAALQAIEGTDSFASHEVAETDPPLEGEMQIVNSPFTSLDEMEEYDEGNFVFEQKLAVLGAFLATALRDGQEPENADFDALESSFIASDPLFLYTTADDFQDIEEVSDDRHDIDVATSQSPGCVVAPIMIPPEFRSVPGEFFSIQKFVDQPTSSTVHLVQQPTGTDKAEQSNEPTLAGQQSFESHSIASSSLANADVASTAWNATSVKILSRKGKAGKKNFTVVVEVGEDPKYAELVKSSVIDHLNSLPRPVQQTLSKPIVRPVSGDDSTQQDESSDINADERKLFLHKVEQTASKWEKKPSEVPCERNPIEGSVWIYAECHQAIFCLRQPLPDPDVGQSRSGRSRAVYKVAKVAALTTQTCWNRDKSLLASYYRAGFIVLQCPVCGRPYIHEPTV